MKQPVKSVLLKKKINALYNIRSCALPISRNAYAIGRRTLRVPVRFVLHEALGLFLTRSLEFTLSTMFSFKCAVDFSSNNSSKIRHRVTVQLSIKSACRNLAIQTSIVSKTKEIQ